MARNARCNLRADVITWNRVHRQLVGAGYQVKLMCGEERVVDDIQVQSLLSDVGGKETMASMKAEHAPHTYTTSRN